MAYEPSSLAVPVGYPTSLIAIDESGSKSSGGRFFVMAAVKVRSPGQLTRAIHDLRDRHAYRGEFKFSDLNSGSRILYYDLIDVLHASDATLHASVVNRDVYDPFPRKQQWEVHREVAALLLRGCINKRELVSVMLDHVSTPRDVCLADDIRKQVNRKLRNGSLVTAFSADSKSSDLLQLADLVASAIGFDRRRRAGSHGQRPPSTSSPKSLVVNRLLSTWGVSSFEDQRFARLNVLTLRGRRPERRLQSVPSASA